MPHFLGIATGQMVHWLCKHIIIRDSHVQQEGHPLSSLSWVTYRTQQSKTSCAPDCLTVHNTVYANINRQSCQTLDTYITTLSTKGSSRKNMRAILYWFYASQILCVYFFFFTKKDRKNTNCILVGACSQHHKVWSLW